MRVRARRATLCRRAIVVALGGAAVLMLAGCRREESKPPNPRETVDTVEAGPKISILLNGPVPPPPDVPEVDEAYEARRREMSARMVRLPPAAFRQLPDAVRAELERRGCMIPQTPEPKPHNVIHGPFMAPRRDDWAVLCSRNGITSILVLQESGFVAVELDPRPDAWFEDHLGSEVFSDRGIGVADADFINIHYQEYGGTKPPPLDHVGIEDFIVEKASGVHYFHRGKWLELSGSD